MLFSVNIIFFQLAQLRVATWGNIVDALRTCGVVVIEDLFDQRFVHELAEAEEAIFQRFLSQTNASSEEAHVQFPEPENFAAAFPALRDFSKLTGTDRVEMKMPFEGAWKSAALWRNLAFPVVASAMAAAEDDLEVDQFTTISSLPGAPASWWHRSVGCARWLRDN